MKLCPVPFRDTDDEYIVACHNSANAPYNENGKYVYYTERKQLCSPVLCWVVTF